jgi:hypothetical protein
MQCHRIVLRTAVASLLLLAKLAPHPAPVQARDAAVPTAAPDQALPGPSGHTQEVAGRG